MTFPLNLTRTIFVTHAIKMARANGKTDAQTVIEARHTADKLSAMARKAAGRDFGMARRLLARATRCRAIAIALTA